MARTNLPICIGVVNGEVITNKEVYDTVNGHEIDVSNVAGDKLVLGFDAFDASGHTVTIKAGDFEDSTLGDLVVTMATAGLRTVYIETSRFKTLDGKILLDEVAGAPNGGIYVVKSPL